ncbi:MAG: DUF1565 domain-containing protein [Candidatus Saccharibacteria bacterium]
MDLLGLFRAHAPSGTRTLYVATTGSDSSNGLTSGTPFHTINAAVNACKAGDRVIVAPGTYAPFSVYSKQGSGAQWITFEGVGASIDCVNNATDGAAGIDVQLGSYVGIYGFEVFGSQTMSPVSISGIAVFRDSDHVLVWNNHVHDFPGGGVNCFYIEYDASNGLQPGGWDCVDVSFNRVHGCCKYDPNNASGISMFGATDTTGQTWDGRYGYRVVGNYVYDCECTVPYTPGGFNFITDGNGISLDSLNTATVFNSGNAPYTKWGLVEGNVVVGCGGRGLHIYNTIKVDDNFNTYAGNLRTVSQAITNGVEADAAYDTPPSGGNFVTHYGNIICPLNTSNTTDGVSTYTSNVILGGTQSVPGGNTDKHATGVFYFTGNPAGASLLTGLPITIFLPVAIDSVPRATYYRGYQALGNGPRSISSWAAGAIETIQPHYFHA